MASISKLLTLVAITCCCTSTNGQTDSSSDLLQTSSEFSDWDHQAPSATSLSRNPARISSVNLKESKGFTSFSSFRKPFNTTIKNTTGFENILLPNETIPETDIQSIIRDPSLVGFDTFKRSQSRKVGSTRKRETTRKTEFSFVGSITFCLAGIGILGLVFWQTRKRFMAPQQPVREPENRRVRRPRKPLRHWL